MGNLKPFTPRNAAEYGRKGGRASGESKRRKRSIREAMETLLSLPCVDVDIRRNLQAAGFKDSESTMAAAVAWQAVQGALNGNPAMMKLVLDTLGENPMLALKEKEFEERYNLADTDRTIVVNFVDNVAE